MRIPVEAQIKREVKPARFSPSRQVSATHHVEDVMSSAGVPLDTATRTYMESHLGYDFSHVRIHADQHAAESAEAINALAYTVGHHIAFAPGRYIPQTSKGKNLVAHELVHVLQQGGSMSPAGGKLDLTDPFGAEEREAEDVVEAATEGKPLAPIQRSAARIARQTGQEAEPVISDEIREMMIREFIIKNKDAVRRSLTPLIDALEDEASREEPRLWPYETRTEKGITVAGAFPEETVEERRSRLEELADDLLSLSIKLRNEPLPSAWLGPEIHQGEGNVHIMPDEGGTATRLYGHHAEELGRDHLTTIRNYHYILSFSRKPEEQVKETECNPEPTDLFIIVPDPLNSPDDFTYAGSESTWGTAVTPVYKDVCDVGAIGGLPYFYYRRNGERWYVGAETEGDVKAMGTATWQTKIHEPPGPPLGNP